jgi:hypothetical protein
MIRVSLFSIILIQSILAEDILKESSILEPKDLNIYKWEFKQKTSLETVAVMRVEHIIAGIQVEVYEEINYWPDREKIGNLLIFSDHKPETIKLPDNNTISFKIDKRSSGIKEGSLEIKGPDGVMRPAHQISVYGKNETINISFYSAPMAVFRKVLPDMPHPEKDGVNGFSSHYGIVSGPYSYGTSTDADGNTKVEVQKPSEGEQAAPRNR